MTAFIPLALLAVLAAIGFGAVMVLRSSPAGKANEAPKEEKKESYGLWSRVVLFLLVAAVLAAIFGGVFVQLGIGMAMTAGGGGGSGMAGLVLLVCPILLVVAGYLIFKR